MQRFSKKFSKVFLKSLNFLLALEIICLKKFIVRKELKQVNQMLVLGPFLFLDGASVSFPIHFLCVIIPLQVSRSQRPNSILLHYFFVKIRENFRKF